MNKYKTISPNEFTRWKKLGTQSLHYYKRLFKKIIIGREADLEFFNMQNQIIHDYVFDKRFKKNVIWQITFYSERYEVINIELEKRILNELKTSIN